MVRFGVFFAQACENFAPGVIKFANVKQKYLTDAQKVLYNKQVNVSSLFA
jgi:hypothetical protein